MVGGLRMRWAAVLVVFATVSSFAPAPQLLQRSTLKQQFSLLTPTKLLAHDEDTNVVANEPTHVASRMAVATVSAWACSPLAAMAASPDWGIFEGKTGSLLHPVMMGSLLVFSAYTAFLGFQWRRQRTMGDEISALKKTLPPPPAEGESPSPMAAEIQGQIAALQDERKSLAAAGPRDKHFSQGALLVFLGTAFAIEGPLNTYARAGKLFPGPHLYVGASLVVLWALATACIPAMQKGNDTARTIHIAANIAGLSFFVWQVVSGVPILLKVWELTKWP